MAVNLNFSKGSNADKDFMTCHLLTGIVARKVINNVLDRSVDALDSECRKVLHDLWISNLKAVGGLPAQQEQLQFDIESIRKLKRLSESLPPVVAKGRMTMPEPFMQRPTLIFKQTESGTGIRESYVLKSVSISKHFAPQLSRHNNFEIMRFKQQKFRSNSCRKLLITFQQQVRDKVLIKTGVNPLLRKAAIQLQRKLFTCVRNVQRRS